MGGRYHTPAQGQASASDFGPGQPHRVEVHHGGQAVVIAVAGDLSFAVPQLIQPQAGAVDVVIHGVSGRFATSASGEIEVPTKVVAVLLENAGVPRGTPLRCLTCHGGERPLAGPPAAELLAQDWGGPVSAADGFLKVEQGKTTVHLGEWDPDPIFGGETFTITHPGQGTFVRFGP
jgi:hypothetical protein